MDASKLQVVLVEDDPAFAVLVTEMLRGAADTTVRPTVDAALQHLAQHPADCVVLDMGLPDLEGPEAIAAVRTACPGTPVLVLTGRDAGEAAALAVAHDAQGSLSKDHVDGPLLEGAIAQAIARQRPDELDAHRRRLAALLEIAASQEAADTRVVAALAQAREHLGLDLGMVARVESERYSVVHADGAGSPPRGTTFPVRRTYCAMVLEAEDVVAIAHMARSPHRDHPCYATFGVETYIGVPLVVEGETWGTVNFSAVAPLVRRWSELDRDYVRLLGRLMGGWLGEAARATRLEEVTSRFRIAFDNAPNGMAVASLDGEILQANRTFGDQLRYAPGELVGRSFAELTDPEDHTATAEFVAGMVEGDADTGRLEKRFVRRDGTVFWGVVHAGVLRDDDGAPRYFVNQVEDITERRAARERLAHLALHDGLTGLPNRVLLEDRLAQELAAAGRRRQAVALLFIDLDRFKAVNDSLGHAAGDALIREVGRRVAEAIRPYDTAARIGGDEFVVVCGGLEDEAAARPIIERIHDAIVLPVDVAGHTVRVGASIGVSFSTPTQPQGAAAMLRSADTAMYEAKTRGRRAFEASAEGLDDVAIEGLVLEQQLRDAIEAAAVGAIPEHGLQLHYQPIHDADGRAGGVEALGRWQHPTRGMLSPATFLPLAEATGLVVPLGRWVLRQALHDWVDTAGLVLSVNVAVQELGQPGYVAAVQAAMAEAGMPAERLCLEVTETGLLHEHGSAMRVLRQLRRLGIRLAIDDFGAGQTALRYLNATPFTDLKIDRSFVVGLRPDTKGWSIFSAILGMCNDLGLRSTVEGVEDATTLSLVRGAGCTTTQGYHHARPAPLEETRRRLMATA